MRGNAPSHLRHNQKAARLPNPPLQVILGIPWGPKIDIWSLGCIIAELLTGRVLFANDTIQTMIARMQSLLGPLPAVLLAGRDAGKYITVSQLVDIPQAVESCSPSLRGAAVVFEAAATDAQQQAPGASPSINGSDKVSLLLPQRSSLQARLRVSDTGFLDFLTALLTLDPALRPTAAQALRHPWLAVPLHVDAYVLPA